MAAIDVDRYLERIGHRGSVAVDESTLEALHRAHLTTVPFENLDVFRGEPVRADIDWSIPKIVDRGRGGWCFEINGAFAALLEAIGFEVRLLGAAVLLSGPATLIDHLVLEVMLDEPHLVDVGFGDSFIRPLGLNRAGAQDGGSGTFELLPSPQGVTLTRHDDGVPAALYRFKRVAHRQADFEVPSERLQQDKTLLWHRRPLATRILDGGPDRVTLLADRLTVHRSGGVETEPVPAERWNDTLHQWFGYRVDGVDPRRGQAGDVPAEVDE